MYIHALTLKDCEKAKWIKTIFFYYLSFHFFFSVFPKFWYFHLDKTSIKARLFANLVIHQTFIFNANEFIEPYLFKHKHIHRFVCSMLLLNRSLCLWVILQGPGERNWYFLVLTNLFNHLYWWFLTRFIYVCSIDCKHN